MEKLTEVLAPNGHPLYAWPSFIAAALVMATMVMIGMRSLRRAERALARTQDLPSMTIRNHKEPLTDEK